MNQDEQIKILEYWRSFESFLMPKIENSCPKASLAEEVTILSETKQLPWPLKIENEDEKISYYFNVYLGIIEQSSIFNKIENMLGEAEQRFDIAKDNKLTCLAALSLDFRGEVIQESYIVPEYVKSLYVLENYQIDKNWSQYYEYSDSIFSALSHESFNEISGPVSFDHLTKYLIELIEKFKCITQDDIKYKVIVHLKKHNASVFDKIYQRDKINCDDLSETCEPKVSNGSSYDLILMSNLPKDNKPLKNKIYLEKQGRYLKYLVNSPDEKTIYDKLDIYVAELTLEILTVLKDEILAEIAKRGHIYADENSKIKPDLFSSFYLNDLNNVICSIKNKSCGLALQEYLAEGPSIPREDVYINRDCVGKLVNPNKLPAGKWPDAYSLSLAQQVAVNVSLDKKEGLFSVNGPPGTGKTTLLRDILSEVVINRAIVLAGYQHPKSAFNSKVEYSSNGTLLRIHPINMNLFGFELVVAAANNNAAENISKELPLLKMIDKKWLVNNEDNDYFSEVAKHYFNDNNDYWGMVSAVLGNQENNNNFFKRFWSEYNHSSMRYILKRWNFHDELFAEAVENGLYGPNDRDKWINRSYRKIDDEYTQKWTNEKKSFEILMKKFNELQSQYSTIEESICKRKDNEINIGLCEKELNEATEKVNVLLQEKEKIVETLNSLKNEQQINYNYKTYSDLQNDSELQRSIVHECEHNLVELMYEIKYFSDLVSDLEREKEDHLQLKPHWLIQAIFYKSTRVNKWVSKFSEIANDLKCKRREHSQIREKIRRLEFKMEAEKIKLEELESTFLDTQERINLLPNNIINLNNLDLTISEITLNMNNCESYLARVNARLNEKQENVIMLSEKLIRFRQLRNNYNNGTFENAQDVALALNDFINHHQNLPIDKYWESDNDILQQSSPWINDKIQSVRIELFWSAIKLHKYFIILARKQIQSNITTLRWMLNGKLLLSNQDEIRTLWASLFLVVPMVSSTFASFQTLFRHLKQNDIGYLFIDEAGQIPPHNAVGALWRSRRAIVVGDPLQLKPIVTLPKSLSCRLYEIHNVKSNYDITSQSVQTLSDQSNPLGTYLRGNDNDIWVGAPLIVHRRCMEPMFSVSNKIAYNGLMIQATKPSPSFLDQYLPNSSWISPLSKSLPNLNSHWIREEGVLACEMIDGFIKKFNKLPPMFVIAPFASVISELLSVIVHDYIKNWSSILNIRIDPLYVKLKKMIGTIHTFQGKQTDGVILLLGGNRNRLGAIAWASAEPNMLNVAVTRAKKYIYVIGDIKLWGNQPNFSVLAKSLRLEYDYKQLLERSLFERV